eukprot:807179_1
MSFHTTFIILLTTSLSITPHDAINPNVSNHSNNTLPYAFATTYFVRNDFTINKSLAFVAPTNVEILFTGSYTITVHGFLSIGCDNRSTFNNHNIGFAVQPEMSLIDGTEGVYNNPNAWKPKGQIFISESGSAFFCNTKLQIAKILYRGTYPNQLIIDNCEVNVPEIIVDTVNIYESNVTMIASGIINYITDNIVTNRTRISGKYMHIANNIFYGEQQTGYDKFLIHSDGESIIFNNTFDDHRLYGDFYGYGAIYTIDSTTNITFNTFRNWNVAIVTKGGVIMHNEFSDNKYAIKNSYDVNVSTQINYNNFLNNTYSIFQEYAQAQPYCSHNYFGTSSTHQSDVSSQIYDLCSGGKGFVTWWPWFIEPINNKRYSGYIYSKVFLENYTLPTQLEATFNITDLKCDHDPGSHPEISGNRLSALYFQSITLNVQNSPYFIVNDVLFHKDVVVTVESGVHLIFAGDYVLFVSGSINMGCNDLNPNQQPQILVTGIDNKTIRGKIQMDGTGAVSFCNTRFENIRYPIYYTGQHTNGLFVNNCEFHNNYVAMNFPIDGVVNTIDSPHHIMYNTFINIQHGLYYVRYAYIANNVFISYGDIGVYGVYGSAIISYGDNNIFNNTFKYQCLYSYCSSTSIALVLSRPRYKTSLAKQTNVTFNSFTGWIQAIIIYSEVNTTTNILYNEFISDDSASNSTAITIKSNSIQNINYNNFIGNTKNIKLENKNDQTRCNYNWNGVDNVVSDPPYSTALKIDDICDSNEDNDIGMVTFWPYFSAPLNLNDLDDLPSLYPFDFINCTRRTTSHPITNDALQFSLAIKYDFHKLTEDNYHYILNHSNIVQDIVLVLKTSYIEISALYSVNEFNDKIHYSQFDIDSEKGMKPTSPYTMELVSDIKCETRSICDTVGFISLKAIFINQTTISLRSLFDNQKLTFSAIFPDDNAVNASPSPRSDIIYGSVSSLGIICLLICGAVIYWRRIYMNAYVVENGLVLIIGISQFDDMKTSFLRGVRQNVSDLQNLWMNQYNYDVFVCKDNLYCSKTDIIDFIDCNTRKLNETQYDSIIVHIISHGSDDYFCSSDGKTVALDFIHHEFITKAEELCYYSLIKLIFHHGCQGINDYSISSQIHAELRPINAHNPLSNNMNKMEKVSCYSNCMTISGNIKGRAMSDSGNFTNCICQSFEKNLNRKIKADFNALVTEIGSNLEQKSNQSEICN